MRAKPNKQIIKATDNMGDGQNMPELREENEKRTQEVPEPVQEKHKKCGCYIF